jgi:hypothetical protein
MHDEMFSPRGLINPTRAAEHTAKCSNILNDQYGVNPRPLHSAPKILQSSCEAPPPSNMLHKLRAKLRRGRGDHSEEKAPTERPEDHSTQKIEPAGQETAKDDQVAFPSSALSASAPKDL